MPVGVSGKYERGSFLAPFFVFERIKVAKEGALMYTFVKED